MTLLSQQSCNDYMIRRLEISDGPTKKSPSSSGFVVTQFQHLKWPEFNVPMTTSSLLEIANQLQKVQIGSGNKAIVVMCK